MPNWTGGIITARGRELQAKVEAGETLVITKMKLGSGTPQAYEMDTLTDLKQPLMEFGISSKTVENNICEVTGVVVSSEIETPFYAREWGLFAQDPDEGEILYMYTTDPNPDFIPAKTAALQISATYALNIVVLNVDNIIVNIDPNGLVTTAILKNELKKYLPLSGGDMTGDITANNVYANNNVLVFNNVEEMKASNKVKAGYTIKTLGFYEANDGGGADYVIVNSIGEDEADEASIISLQKDLYAKLLVQDFVNVKQMGAKAEITFNKDWSVDNLENASDDTEYINKAIKFAYNNNVNVVLPYKAYKIEGTITLYSGVTLLPIGDCFFAFTGEKSNICLEIEQTQVRQGNLDMAGMYIDNSLGKLFVVNKKTDKSNTIGLKLEALDGLSLHPHFKGLIISDFETGIYDYARNIYFLQFSDCVFRCCTVIYRFGEGVYTGKNAGERTCFTNCVFSSSNCVFYTFPNAEISVINCSIDHNSLVMYLNYSGAFNFIATHFEAIGFKDFTVGPVGNSTDNFEGKRGLYYYNDSGDLRLMPSVNMSDCTYVTNSKVVEKFVDGKGLFSLINFEYAFNDYFSKEQLIDKQEGAMDCMFYNSNAIVNIINPKSMSGVGVTIMPASKNVLKNNGWFGESDVQTISSGMTTLENYVLNAPYDGSVSIKENEWGKRSLFINAQNTFFLRLTSKVKYPVNHSKIGSMMFTKVPRTIANFNDFICTILANFYNSAGEKIGDSVKIGSSRQDFEASFYQDNKGVLLACEGDYGALHSVIIPQEAATFEVEIQAQLFKNQSSSGEYQVGGFRVYTWD